MVQRSCDLKIGLWQRAVRKVTKALYSKVLTGAGVARHFSLKQLCRTSVPSRRRQHPRRPHHPHHLHHHRHHHHHHHHHYIPLNTPLHISKFFTPLSPCLPPFPYTFPAFVSTPSPQVVAQESSQLISQGQLRFLPGQGQGHQGRGETGRGRGHSDCVMLGGNSGRWLGDRKWIMNVMTCLFWWENPVWLQIQSKFKSPKMGHSTIKGKFLWGNAELWTFTFLHSPKDHCVQWATLLRDDYKSHFH